MRKLILLLSLILLFAILCVACDELTENDASKGAVALDNVTQIPYTSAITEQTTRKYNTQNPVQYDPNGGGGIKVYSVVNITNTYDPSIHPPLGEAEEMFYSDGNYEYYFNYIDLYKYIIVTYDDGTTLNIKEAFEYGMAQISELAFYGISFSKVPLNIKQIVSINDTYDIYNGEPLMDALELFYSDDEYNYFFSSLY